MGLPRPPKSLVVPRVPADWPETIRAPLPDPARVRAIDIPGGGRLEFNPPVTVAAAVKAAREAEQAWGLSDTQPHQ